MRNRRPQKAVARWLTITLLMACSSHAADAAAAAKTTPDPDYRRSILQWRQELLEDRRETWIPLAGLFWLKPGENTFGSARSNRIVLPKGSAPARAGAFELQDGEVIIRVQPGVEATAEGQPFTSQKLQPDASGEPTIVKLGRLRLHVIKRAERLGIRVKDLEHPALRKPTRLHFFPLDTTYRVTATWIPGDGKRKIAVPNVIGTVEMATVPGEARFQLNGRDLTLTAVSSDDKELFFVFSDHTSKRETYPAGRFLYADLPVNGIVILDFNKAYNPPCAVTPYATCPIAPKENRLPARIAAGEKFDHKSH